MIQVLETTQLFALVDGGGFTFACTKVLYLRDGMTYCARWPHKLSEQNIDPERLEEERCISSYRGPLHANHAIAPDPSQCFIKRPKLTWYEDQEEYSTLVRKELVACEIIRDRPHPNVAEYHGCQVSDGRIEGLCFTKYRETLLDALNPDGFNKSMFIVAKDLIAKREKVACHLPGIEDGIRHLHSLGLIHNDINPSNIMLNNNNEAIITDFDSSRAPGESLERVKRTYGWYDPDVHVAQESNDLDALAELRVWLTSSSPADFRFGG